MSRRWSHYIELTKPRILIMILVTLVISMIAVGGALDVGTAIHACLGTAMVAASASVLNQWAERERDRIMQRTSRRPLPTGRVAASEAAWMGWLLVIVGLVYLYFCVNVSTTLCGLLTWFLYVWVYTPLKMTSWTNTLVGTIPGALPVWMGWTAAGGSLLDGQAWVLLGLLVMWQLPHFMAIAWLYREQYAAASYKMITVTDPSGRGAWWHAIVGALLLAPLSVLAIWPADWISGMFCGGALFLSGWMIRAAWRFGRDRSTARSMLRVSLLHLPLVMLLILANHLFH